MKKRKQRKLSPIMKLLIAIECFAIVSLLVLCFYKSENSFLSNIFKESPPDVILDAGHGGFDVGCENGTVYEKDINLAFVKEIGAKLETKGYRVAYVRDSDEVDWADNESDDLKYRTKLINKSGAKIMVSIHVNSEDVDSGSYGYEAWGKLKNANTFALAKNILNSVSTLGYSQNRGMKDQDISPLYILNNTKLSAILFEVGFISSDVDVAYLTSGTEQKKFANQIAEGIAKSLEAIEKAEEKEEKSKT